MRKLALVVVGCLIPVLAGCPSPTTPKKEAAKEKEVGKEATKAKDNEKPPAAAKPKELIVGVWENTDANKKGTQEFKADGTLVLKMEGGEMKGNYKFVEDELMEVELDPGAGAPKIKQKVKVKIDKDELTTTDEKDVDKFKRVKK